MREYPGRDERRTARSLTASLAAERGGGLSYRGVDLTAATEHLLYTALVHGELPEAPPTWRALLLAIGRPVAAFARMMAPGPSLTAGAIHLGFIAAFMPVAALVCREPFQRLRLASAEAPRGAF